MQGTIIYSNQVYDLIHSQDLKEKWGSESIDLL